MTAGNLGWRFVVALMALAISGCLAGPNVGLDNEAFGPLTREWSWTLPPGETGTFHAEIHVQRSKATPILILFHELSTPNQNGELLYVEAYWKSEPPGWRAHSVLMLAPGGSPKVLVHHAGTDLAGPVDVSQAALQLPSAGETPFPLKLPKRQKSDTLILVGLAQRDASQPEPLDVTFRMRSEEPSFRADLADFQPGTAGGFALHAGDFDGADTTRVQATYLSAAAARKTVNFTTHNRTVFIVEGRLEGDAGLGVGEMRVTAKSSRETIDAKAGGVGGWDTVFLHERKTYADTWTVDVEFLGEGYMFVVWGDVFTTGTPPHCKPMQLCVKPW